MKLDENGIPTLFNCAYCNDVKVLPGYNSFKARHEDLMAEWDYTKNNDLGYDPDLISDANIRYVSWLCSTCGMKYTDFVKNRIFDKENGIISCPYCSGRKALPGYNTFKVRHKDLMDEWSDIENALLGVNPDNILDNNDDPVWWKCINCKSKYIMSVKDRLMKQKRNHNPCTICDGRRWKKIHYI